MRELARRSGLSAAQISRVESGDILEPAIETLGKLADGLDRDGRWLLVGLGRMPFPIAIDIVCDALRTLPPGQAGRLAGAYWGIKDQEKVVNDLQMKRLWLDSEAATVFDVRSTWRLEREGAKAHVADTMPSHHPGKEREHAEALAALRRATSEVEAAEARLADIREQVNKLQPALDVESERLEHLVSRVAGELFMRPRWQPLAIEPSPPRTPVIRGLSREASVAAFDRLEADAGFEEAHARLLDWPTDRGFRGLARAWIDLTDERRSKVLDYVADQQRLSTYDKVKALDTDEVAPTTPAAS